MCIRDSSLLTGLFFGLAPALQSSKLDLNEALKEGGRQTSAGSGSRLRNAMVVSEIALAVVLLIGAGLMMKSLLRLLQTNLGFQTENLLTMTVIAPPSKYADVNQQINFNDQLRQRVQALPGVAGAGTVNILPVNSGNTTRFFIDGDPVPAPGKETEANIRTVSGDYFKTLGVPLLAGRMFDDRDTNDKPGVVIIGKTIADRMFAGRDPVGMRLKYSSFQGPPDLILSLIHISEPTRLLSISYA